MTKPPPPHRNRLARAASPYLLQHAENPVDWYEWSPEALERARRENKPIFLSIGYSACHWCHVMAHESFENPDVADVMNRHFINIKVDREERPDLDDIYMQATMLLNQGQGGWPMSVWLTPDLRPFVAGTYFPPEDRWGRKGFARICEEIGSAWVNDRDQVEQFATRLTDAVQSALRPEAAHVPLSLAVVDDVAEKLADVFDVQKGGILSGGMNKFPPSMALDLLLRSAWRNRADISRYTKLTQRIRVTLDRMAYGGIYDQLAGGIHRYSTDPDWLVPHFEKMLYDQALVSRMYVEAWQHFRDPLYRRVATEIFDYVIDDLQSPAGGLYSTRDADSEGEEGKYYVWTRAEITGALGEQDADLFCDYYDVSATGNWRDPHAPGVEKNILNVGRAPDAVAKLHAVTVEELQARVAAGRRKLLAVRAQRVAPGRDDKVLCEWNGMMIAAMARGGFVFGERKYVDAAAAAADFLLREHRREGRLLRSSRGERKLETAFLTDYANLIEGLLELHEATFAPRWLGEARALLETAIDHFWDDADGGFFFTASDHEQLITRNKDMRDSATPSGNSVMLMNLARLGVITGDRGLREKAEAMLRVFAGDMLQHPGASERFLCGMDFLLSGPAEIVIAGDPGDAATEALLDVVRRTYVPNRVLLLRKPDDLSAEQRSPLLAGRELVDNRPAAYVCRDYTCSLPATSPAELETQLGNA